jgi:hypothetical protein
MIGAYKAGIPGNGKPFPDGARMAKIHWMGTKCRMLQEQYVAVAIRESSRLSQATVRLSC